MRRLLLAAAMVATACGAQAADMPDFLRGSIPASSSATRNWEGWYVGGQASYSSAEIDFSHAPQSLVSFMLREDVLQPIVSQWGLLTKNHAQGNGFGGFVGRNFQWDEAVFSLEANYNYINSLSSSSTGAMRLNIYNPAGLTPPDGHTFIYDTSLSGTAALRVKDVSTFRARAGWAAGNFLPYLFGGLAVGRMDASRTATLDVTKHDKWDEVQTSTSVNGTVSTTTATTIHHDDVTVRPTQSQVQTRSDNYVIGWSAGLGTEYMFWNCMFVRAEWEYIKFQPVMNMVTTLNTARVGIGYKF
jgi:opacity protein-like surface antigen